MLIQVYFGESLWIICKMSPIIMANQELKHCASKHAFKLELMPFLYFCVIIFFIF